MFRITVAIGICAVSAQVAFSSDRSVEDLTASIADGSETILVVDSGKQYTDFLAKLRNMESSGDYQAVNTLNFIGAYQFGEAALVDLGYVRRDRDLYNNDFGGGFTGKNGIRSVNDFLNNESVQDKAAMAWMKLMWKYIQADGLEKYAWRNVGDVELTPSGMLAATHLLGSGALKEFVKSRGRGDIRDPYGMPLSRYINILAGYDIPFAPPKPAVVASLGI